MICALSGQKIVVPVVSSASGKVFEKSVIEAWIAERGTDPITKKPLALEQLVNMDMVPANPELVKTTSIPGLLKALQTEFNALVLENHALTESLRTSRDEVQAALRVITRLRGDSGDFAKDDESPSKRRKYSENKKEGTDKNKNENIQSVESDNNVTEEASNPPVVPSVVPTEHSNSQTEQFSPKNEVKKPDATTDSSSMPTIDETMKLEFHNVTATKQALNSLRKQMNSQNEKSSLKSEPVEIEFLKTPAARGGNAKLRILQYMALTNTKLIDLNTGNQQTVRSPTFWVTESVLCSVKNRTIQLVDTNLKNLDIPSVSVSGAVIDIMSHPAGYLLVRFKHEFSIYKLWDLTLVRNVDINGINGFTLHPDGELLFVTSENDVSNIIVYSMSKLISGEEDAVVSTLGTEKEDSPAPAATSITQLTPSPNGYFLAYVIDNKALAILDLRYDDGPRIFSDIGTARVPIKSLCFDNTGFQLVVSSGSNGVHLLTYSSNNASEDGWDLRKINDSRVSAIGWYDHHVIGLR